MTCFVKGIFFISIVHGSVQEVTVASAGPFVVEEVLGRIRLERLQLGLQSPQFLPPGAQDDVVSKVADRGDVLLVHEVARVAALSAVQLGLLAFFALLGAVPRLVHFKHM